MPDSVVEAVADAPQPIQRRAPDIVELFRADPGGYDEVRVERGAGGRLREQRKLV